MADSFRRGVYSPESTDRLADRATLVDDPMDLDTNAYYAEVGKINARREPTVQASSEPAVQASSWSSPPGSRSSSPPKCPLLLEEPSSAAGYSVELSLVSQRARESIDKSESGDTIAYKRRIEEELWRREQNRHHLREIDECWGRGWNVNNPNIYLGGWDDADADPANPLSWEPSLMGELRRLARLTRGRAEEIVPELEHYLLAEGRTLSERNVGLFADMVENLPMGHGHFDWAAMLDMCRYSVPGVPGGRHVRWSDV